MLVFRVLLPFIFLSSLLSASDPDPGLPWFTGPLLTPSPYTIQPGHINVEPYVFYVNNNAIYDQNGDKNTIISKIHWIEEVPVQIGVAKNLEFDIVPGVSTNKFSGDTYTSMNDTLAALYYQIYRNNEKWIPAFKLGLRVLFPTGNFHRFNPADAEIETTGDGSFKTTFTLGIGKAYHIYEEHYLNFRTFFAYGYSFPTQVEGFNAYGGGYGTYGEVYPGNTFSWLLGLEYSLTKNWVLACDVQYEWAGKTRFIGEKGTMEPISVNPLSPSALIGSPSGWQWSLAPAIEYNWNTHIGVIVGPWFTIAGKNTGAFLSIAAAINIWY